MASLPAPTSDVSPASPAPAAPTRRRALLGAVGLAGLLAVRACVPWRAVALPSTLVHLTPSEARLFARLLPVFLPPPGSALLPPDRLPVLENIDAQVGRLPRPARALLRQALLALEHGAVPLGGALTRATNLSDAALADWLAAWSRGGALQRAAFGAVKQLVVLGYYGAPGAWPALQYDGPVTDVRGIARLGNQPLPAGEP